MVLTVLYGTQTGLAERTAMSLCAWALRRGVGECRCVPADDFPLGEWADASPLVIVTSNANQGAAPDTIRASWAQLLSPDAPRMDGLRFAVFGVGDSLYRKFNFMAKMLHNRLQQLGGVAVLHRGLGDESDARGIGETFVPWVRQLCRLLVPGGTAGAGDDSDTEEPPPPLTKYHVEIFSHADEVLCVPPRHAGTFDCVVERNTRLTSPDHFQSVHEVTFSRRVRYASGSTAPIAYSVGDALGVFVANSDAAVDAFLRHTGLDGDVAIRITPNCAEGLIAQRAQPFFGVPLRLRDVARHFLDLEAVVGPAFFAALLAARCAESDAESRERLAEFAAPAGHGAFLSYAHREKRRAAEVLDDFCRGLPPVPLALLLSHVEPMRPRLFSIASAPRKDAESVALVVARLAWRTPYGREREGLCSARLCDAAPGAQFECFVWPGAVPLPPNPAPMICVATGTGIAPVRALLRECAAAEGGAWAHTPVMLFFGCRGEQKDYICAAEWEDMSREALHGLEVVPAFSRDGPTKVYVQHRMGQRARRVAQLIEEGAYVYVCGNAKQMPKDVGNTLLDIVTQCCCGGDVAEGEKYVRRLEREGRYIVDTWSA